uniref:BMP family lipoprotein n=1 Tax=Parolsenella massiliensis TaxID=1871022 RepID=UPI0009334831|nr:BMP family ABC transporter substrate-binding protein [Parolsenella massiliensis]
MKDHKLVSRRDAIKLGAGAATAAAALSLVGCGGSSDNSGSGDAAEAKDSYKVALVISGPALDGGWGQGHYESLQKACEENSKWEMLEPKENTASADAATAAQSYVDQDVDLIIAAGNEFCSDWAEVVAEAAESHPNVHFLMTNTDPSTDLADYETLDNLETVQVNLKQAGSLAGVVAGLMTKSNCIGFVGGMRIPTTLTKYSAYLAAAQKVNSGVKGVYNFEAGFSDASAGVKLTESWIGTDNVDVMWCDASAVDGGVRQALETAGADTHFNIAQPIDLCGSDHPCVITSTVTDWKMGEAMSAIEDGSFGGGRVIEANIDNGGISLGKYSDAVPQDVQDKVAEYTDQIKADTLVSDDEVEAIRSGL